MEEERNDSGSSERVRIVGKRRLSVTGRSRVSGVSGMGEMGRRGSVFIWIGLRVLMYSELILFSHLGWILGTEWIRVAARRVIGSMKDTDDMFAQKYRKARE